MATKTPATSSTGYCTPAESLLYCDPGRVGELVRDDGTTASPSDLLSDPVWAALLLSASGELEAACMAGRKYAVEDLEALASGGGAGAALLQKIVARYAYGDARRRRGFAEDDDTGYFKSAAEYLERLRKGERIFPFLETEGAGNPSVSEPTLAERRRAGDPVALWPRNFGPRLAERAGSGPGGDDGFHH